MLFSCHTFMNLIFSVLKSHSPFTLTERHNNSKSNTEGLRFKTLSKLRAKQDSHFFNSLVLKVILQEIMKLDRQQPQG